MSLRRTFSLGDLSQVASYEKPLVKFERLIETYLSFAPKGLMSLWEAMPVWVKEKALFKRNSAEEIIKFYLVEN